MRCGRLVVALSRITAVEVTLKLPRENCVA